MKREATDLPECPTLSMDDIRAVAEQFKDDLMREGKRAVRQKNLEAATAAFAAEDYIDKFIYVLQLRVGSQLDTLKRPARARPIREDLTKQKGEK